MNIKSLLLGSAATLVAATGAKAADAIVVAEPEPVNYVRVCDAYGAGFFYIPGTETCISVKGYVWLQLAASTANEVILPTNDGDESFDYPVWSTRIRVNFDTRSDTEWGTLRGYIRLQSDWNSQNQTAGTWMSSTDGELDSNSTLFIPGDGRAVIDQAYLQLGGFQAGYSESGWVVTQYGGVSNWGSHSWDGMKYGSQQRQAIMYGFTSNGFHATLSLEDNGNANWMPDIVGVAGYNAAWGGVWVKAAYDEDIGNFVSGFTPLYTPPVGDSGWAASLGTQLNVPNMPGSSLRVLAFYADNANAYNVGGEWSVLASYRHQFASNLAASAAVQYFYNTDFDDAGSPDRWRGEVSVAWLPVTNFEVRAEIFYDKPEASDDTTSGFLRFTRFF